MIHFIIFVSALTLLDELLGNCLTTWIGAFVVLYASLFTETYYDKH